MGGCAGKDSEAEGATPAIRAQDMLDKPLFTRHYVQPTFIGSVQGRILRYFLR